MIFSLPSIIKMTQIGTTLKHEGKMRLNAIFVDKIAFMPIFINLLKIDSYRDLKNMGKKEMDKIDNQSD